MAENKWESDDTEQDEFGMEKAALVDKELEERLYADGEMYSPTECWKARSFKFALLISLVSLLLLSLLVVGVATGLAVSSSRKNTSKRRIITLDDVFDSDFKAKMFGGTWMGDVLVYMTTRGVTLYNPSLNTTEVLIKHTELEPIGNVSAILPSPSYLLGGEANKKLLLAVNSSDVYRHSKLAEYYLYSVPTKEMVRLTKPSDRATSKFQYVAWSPDGQQIAYVLDYNLYVVGVNQSASSPIALTTGGSKNGISYGIPDWVYEEEVLSSDHALWWSPDSHRILFGAFDDTLVESYSFPQYGNMDQQYDTIETIPYPKPGTINPIVKLYVMNISDLYTNLSLVPGFISNLEHYLAYAGWVDAERPYAGWLHRRQIYVEYCVYTDGNGLCNSVYSYDKPGGWVEQYASSDVIFLPISSDSVTLLTLLSQDVGGDRFTHLASVHNSEVTFLTGPGSWSVTSIVGHYQQEIFYLSTEKGAWQRHLYSYNLVSEDSVCLSCKQDGWDVPTSPNEALPGSCDYFLASCDRKLKFCLLHCRGPGIPYSLLTMFDSNQRKLQAWNMLEPNSRLREAVSNLILPTVQKFTVPSGKDAPELSGRLILPPKFNRKSKYPVLFFVYGGPGSQVVTDSSILNSLSHLFYVSNLSLILASVDGRGCAGRGDRFKFSVVGNLGHLETIDQIRAGRYLQSLDYVDKNKLAIYGSSYGGYMAGNVGSSGSGVFRTAISQSPVSDWHYYDSIYTERYMSAPKDNVNGYRNSSLLLRANRLQDVDYLLIHGTGDDNVHYQHTAQLAEALTQADVQFRMQVYTDKTHSLKGGNTKHHLYQLIADFLTESFKT